MGYCLNSPLRRQPIRENTGKSRSNRIVESFHLSVKAPAALNVVGGFTLRRLENTFPPCEESSRSQWRLSCVLDAVWLTHIF